MRNEGQIQVNANITIVGWYDKASEKFEPTDPGFEIHSSKDRLGEDLTGKTRDGFARAIRRLLGLPRRYESRPEEEKPD